MAHEHVPLPLGRPQHSENPNQTEDTFPQVCTDLMPDDLRLEAARCSEAASSDTPVAAQQIKKPKNQQLRLFLDLFAGVNAPLTKAMHAQGSDYFQPFDLERDPKCNMLDDSVFAILLRMAWSGLVGAVWSPPCKEYSRLKLRPGGPKALRTPEHMEGIPGLTEYEQRRVDQSKAIHDRGRQVLQAAFSTAAQGGLEQPPSSMAWLEPENIQLLREWAAHCAHVPACQHGMDFYKSWALCATFPGIATLGGTCSHPPGSHRLIAGVKNNGQYLSASTAQYPLPSRRLLPPVWPRSAPA